MNSAYSKIKNSTKCLNPIKGYITALIMEEEGFKPTKKCLKG